MEISMESSLEKERERSVKQEEIERNIKVIEEYQFGGINVLKTKPKRTKKVKSYEKEKGSGKDTMKGLKSLGSLEVSEIGSIAEISESWGKAEGRRSLGQVERITFDKEELRLSLKEKILERDLSEKKIQKKNFLEENEQEIENNQEKEKKIELGLNIQERYSSHKSDINDQREAPNRSFEEEKGLIDKEPLVPALGPGLADKIVEVARYSPLENKNELNSGLNNFSLRNLVESSEIDMKVLISELMEGDNEEKFSAKQFPPDLKLATHNLKESRRAFLTDTITDQIFNQVLDELLCEDFWDKSDQSLEAEPSEPAYPLQIESRVLTTETSDAETVYGIRTNYNAVNEYCNLLIAFLTQNYSQIIITRLNKSPPINSEAELRSLRLRNERLQQQTQDWAPEEASTGEETPPGFSSMVLDDSIFEELEEQILVKKFFI